MNEAGRSWHFALLDGLLLLLLQPFWMAVIPVHASRTCSPWLQTLQENF